MGRGITRMGLEVCTFYVTVRFGSVLLRTDSCKIRRYPSLFLFTLAFGQWKALILTDPIKLTFISPLCSGGNAPGGARLQPSGHASVHLRAQIPGHSPAGDRPREESRHPAPTAHQQVSDWSIGGMIGSIELTDVYFLSMCKNNMQLEESRCLY